MALDLSGLTKYVDECNVQLIRKNVFTADSLFQLFPNWETGIKTKKKIGIISVDANLGDCACGWSNDGNQEITERFIEVACIKSADEICDIDLIEYFTGKMIRIGAGVESLGQLYEEFVDGIMDSIRKRTEALVWQGDTASADDNLNKFDGIIKIIEDETPADQKITITSGSALNNLLSLSTRITQNMTARGNVVAFVDPRISEGVWNSLFFANLYNYAASANGEERRLPNGLRLIPAEGLRGTGAVVITPLSNIVIGTDFQNDLERVKFWYSDDDQIWKYIIKFFLGVQIIFPDEIIYATMTDDVIYGTGGVTNVNIVNDPLVVSNDGTFAGA